jgi:hypothetical protein
MLATEAPSTTGNEVPAWPLADEELLGIAAEIDHDFFSCGARRSGSEIEAPTFT